MLALTLSGGPLLAASREDRAYRAAVLTFHDKLYSAAEAELTQFLQTYRKSTNAPAAVLLLAQSEYYLKNYAAAGNRLADPVNLASAKAAGLGDQYDYWRAEAQFAAGDFGGAAETFAAVGEDYPASPLVLPALVDAAAAFGKNDNWPRADDLLASTNGLFQRRARLEPANEQVVNGRLLQAESKCAQQDFAGAVQVLGLVNPATLAPEPAWKRALLLYRANLGSKNLDGALAVATNLVQIARLGAGDRWATNLAESVACRAEALQAMGRLPEAAEVWQENLGANVPAEQQRRAILKVADLAVAENLSDAEARLENFLAQYPDSPAGGVARLRLGELQLQAFIGDSTATDELAHARSNLDEIIKAEPGGPLAGGADLDRGWCDWLEATKGDSTASAAKFAESLTNFQAAATVLPRGSEDLAVACFKTGDAQFALADYAKAINSYRAVLTDFSGQTNVARSLGDRALYQILRAQLELHDTNGMDDSMSQLLGSFSASGETANGLLLAGQGFSDFGDPARARALFERFGQERPTSRLMPQVLFALARTYGRERNWPATVTNCEAWLRSYPNDETNKPQVEYFRDWAVGLGGDEARAFGLFTNFVTRYTTNADLTPLARWWVADYYFRQGTNFLDAEREYQHIFQDFPNNPDKRLTGQAQLMAARVAMVRSQYPQAINYLTPLIGNTNAPGDLRDKAKLAYSEALQGMTSETNTVSLLEATQVLAQLYFEAPTNKVGPLAWCETGDCDLKLGALDAATNAFAQVLTAPSADVELRCRARVGWGVALEKKADGLGPESQRALLTLALENYHEVIYTQDRFSDPFWMKKAALQALPLMPLVGEANVKDFIDRLEHWLPQLTDILEKKRAAALKE
ncbi:MAG: tetratricopeptide repeat protein [Verrucomicrobiota bacterium]